MNPSVWPKLTAGALILAALIAWPAPAFAKILKTRRPVKKGQPHELLLDFGSGFEYERDSEHTESGYPFLLEYGFTNTFKITVEPSYVSINSSETGSTRGLGDLETGFEWEFLPERRYRPALAMEGIVKWPTAARGEIGTGETDYTLGAIVSKEFVHFDTDFNASYTKVGSPPGFHLQDTLEVSLAAEWHISRIIDIEAEFVTTHGSGGFRGQTGTLGGLGGIPSAGLGPVGNESEWTLGLAEHVNDFLKFEEGGIIKSDGSWQFVFAWEYDFAGGR